MAPPRQTTFDVRIWGITKVPSRGKDPAHRRTTYELRWMVAKKRRSKTFTTSALATSYRADLLSSANRGEPFDIEHGLPISMLPRQEQVTWWQWALEYVDLKWPALAPNSRLSLAEGLTAITMALLVTDRGRPDPARLRKAMMQWAFITPRRKTGNPPPQLETVAAWLAKNTVPLTALEDAATVRSVLDALACKLDGTRAAATTIARKRAVLFNALDMAAERDLLDSNPLQRVRWRTPKSAEAIDPACVVNPKQARSLLAAVAQVGETNSGQIEEGFTGTSRTPPGGRLVAFFGCLYHAGTRPSEALALRESDLDLPEDPRQWGLLRLSRNDPEVTAAWTDNGKREARQLKHRARGEVRLVPCSPTLAGLLQAHLDTYGTGLDGRLFTGPRGGVVKESIYTDAWQQARRIALTPAEVISPLVARPYDLRHSCVSTWLAAGVDPAQIAKWVGHSVAVLHRVYAHVLPGRYDVARRQIDTFFNHEYVEGDCE